MKNLTKTGIELRLKQDFLDKFTSEFENDISGYRDRMYNYIMEKINEIVHVEDKQLYKKLSFYLAKNYSKSDLWLYPKQSINLAIVNAYHYGESGLAIPPNEKVLSFLLPKLTAQFNVFFVKTGKEDLFSALREGASPCFYRKNWDFYRLTLIQ